MPSLNEQVAALVPGWTYLVDVGICHDEHGVCRVSGRPNQAAPAKQRGATTHRHSPR